MTHQACEFPKVRVKYLSSLAGQSQVHLVRIRVEAIAKKYP